MFSLARKNFYVNGFLVISIFERKKFSVLTLRCLLFSLTPPGGISLKNDLAAAAAVDPGKDHGKRRKIYIVLLDPLPV